MKKHVKCITAKNLDCEQSLVFYFMRSAKWVALALLVGIGGLSAALQFQRQQEELLAEFSRSEIRFLHPSWLLKRLQKAYPAQCNHGIGQ